MSIAEKLTTIADNMQSVYDKGYQGGNDDYRTAFWNGFQGNGERTDYTNAFRNWKNADKYWKPTCDIRATTYSYAFYSCDMNGASLPDLCKQAGITIDYSKSTGADQCFSYCNISDVGTIDARNWATFGLLLYSARNVKKAHIILRDDGSQMYTSSFTGATGLTDLIIEGAIGKNISLGDCPLNKASIENVFDVLLSTATGQTVTFKKTAVDIAFETSDGAADGSTSTQWAKLIATKPNWTITLK